MLLGLQNGFHLTIGVNPEFFLYYYHYYRFRQNFMNATTSAQLFQATLVLLISGLVLLAALFVAALAMHKN